MAKASINDEKWEYWLSLKSWGLIEAAFILDGIIPSDKTMRQYGFHKSSPGPNIWEDDMELIYKKIKRDFPEKKVSPKECFNWAEENEIKLDKKLEALILERGLIKSSPNLAEEDKMSPAGKKRYKALEIALRVLNDPSEREALLHKNGTFILEKLAIVVASHSDELAHKNGNGSLGYQGVYDAIQIAVMGQNNKKKLGTRALLPRD